MGKALSAYNMKATRIVAFSRTKDPFHSYYIFLIAKIIVEHRQLPFEREESES